MEKKQSPEMMLLRLSAVAVAIGVLVSAAIVTANVTDEHIGNVADKHNRPLVSMLRFIMQKDGLWDEYQREQAAETCADNLTLGLPCVKEKP